MPGWSMVGWSMPSQQDRCSESDVPCGQACARCVAPKASAAASRTSRQTRLDRDRTIRARCYPNRQVCASRDDYEYAPGPIQVTSTGPLRSLRQRQRAIRAPRPARDPSCTVPSGECRYDGGEGDHRNEPPQTRSTSQVEELLPAQVRAVRLRERLAQALFGAAHAHLYRLGGRPELLGGLPVCQAGDQGQ